MAKTPQQMTDKYKSGVSNGGAAFAQGIQQTQKDPIQLAIAAAPKYIQRLQDSFANGSYVKGLGKSNKAAWTAGSVAAQSKYTGSANAGAQKYNRYATAAAPQIAAFQAQVDAMPNITDADAEARAVKMIQLMRTLKGT